MNTPLNANTRIHLDDVCELLGYGEHLDAIAARLGVTRDAITKAVRTRGTPAQTERIRKAAADLAEHKRRQASQAQRTRPESGTRTATQ